MPPALVVLTAPDDAPFLCLAPPALGEEVVLGLPAPTLVALAAGPGMLSLCCLNWDLKLCDQCSIVRDVCKSELS